MGNSPIHDDLNALRNAASDLGKRASSFKLYSLLKDCMAAAERAASGESEMKELKEAFTSQETGGNRRYIESTTDEYMLVCRYVFHTDNGNTGRNQGWRYGKSLSVAASMGFNSETIGDALKTKGGINAFFQRRKQPNPLVKAKVLRLTQQIEIPSDRPFTLTLRRLPDNLFEIDVLDVS